MRSLLLVPFAALVLGCAANNNGTSTSKSATQAPVASQLAAATQAGTAAATKPPTLGPTKAPTAAPPGLGQPVKVGDLDLTVNAVHAVDTKQFNQFNAADTAVDIAITNARGESYDFNAYLAMQLVDSSGVAHKPELGCAGCPNNLSDAKLVKGGHAEGSVYYKLAGAVPASVLYQSLGSTNKVTIPVTQ